MVETTMLAANEVRIQRYQHSPKCEVIVSLRSRELRLRFADYGQALRWAQVECKSYGIASVSVGQPITAKTDEDTGEDQGPSGRQEVARDA